MKLNREILDKGLRAGYFTSPQASEQFWQLAEREQAKSPIPTILTYLGGLIAGSGVAFYVTIAFEKLYGLQIAGIALAVMAVAIGLAEYARRENTIETGVLALVATAATPLFVYGIQKHLGYWGEGTSFRSFHTLIHDKWIIMEVATIVAAFAAFARYRVSFILMPLTLTIWYLVMDVSHILAEKNDLRYWDVYRDVSLKFGFGLTLATGILDATKSARRDHTFWIQLVGVTLFWGALLSMDPKNELSRLGFAALSVGMIGVGMWLSRLVFIVAGTIGVLYYIWHLAFKLFPDLWALPVAFAAVGIGLVVIALGTKKYFEHQPA